MHRVLVTGGMGFVGSCFVRYLLRLPEVAVGNLDKLTYAGNPDTLAAQNGHKNYTFFHADIAVAQDVDRVFREFSPTAIVHLAAESHVDRSIACAHSFVRTNVTGTCVLLACALRYWQQMSQTGAERFRFVQVSTDEVFGSIQLDEQATTAFTERSAFLPNSPYAASKAGADHLARAWWRTHGFPVLTTHCTNNMGPYQHPEKFIPCVILNALAGRQIPVYGDGSQIRDWMYVEDHAAGLWRAVLAGKPGNTYMLGARNAQSNLKLVHKICEIIQQQRLGVCPDACWQHVTHVADRPGHDVCYKVEPARTEQDLGWQAQHSFQEALTNTVLWYARHQNTWCQQMLARQAEMAHDIAQL